MHIRVSSLFSSSERSRKIQINIVLNIIFRGLAVFCNFLIVPVSLAFISKEEYGVWLTINSISAWISYLDGGLGNGLRNKLAEAVAKNDRVLAKEYVSTAYVVFSILIFIVLFFFIVLNFFLDWNLIFQSKMDASILSKSVFIVIFSFCVRLLLDLSVTVMVALQRAYLRSAVDFFINFTTLGCVFFLQKANQKSFLIFSGITAIVPVGSLFAFNFYCYYFSKFKYLRPLVSFFKKRHLKSLLNIGIQFFVIQFAGLIVFSTDNLLITQFLSPVEVTSFNIAYKYFSIITLVFSVILLPYWSAFTNAFVRKDNVWIKNAFKRLLLVWMLQVFGVVFMILVSDYGYRLWLGNRVVIPKTLSISLGVYCLIFNWNNIFAYFLNGVSKVRLQLYSSILIGIVNIPLSYILLKYSSFGLASVVISNCLCLLVSSIWSPIQCYKIIYNKAIGVWGR